MSLVNNNLMTVVKKQYVFKLQSFSRFFLVIIATQILGMLFSLTNAGGMSASSNEIYSFSIDYNSTIQVFIFTLACVTGITVFLNLKEYKDIDFTFVSNRMSSNLSNIGFLITLSLFGAITSALSGVLIRTIKYLLIGSSKIAETGFFLTPLEIMCSIGATFLYILLLSSVVYFCTAITKKSNIFIIVILAVFVLLPQTPVFSNLVGFYVKEHNFLIFMIKTMITGVIFFLASVLVSNNMEVRG
jgi:hypothetical protein